MTTPGTSNTTTEETGGGNGNENATIPAGNTPPVLIDFDRDNTTDAANVVGQITQIAKIEYDGTNLERWLRRLEIRMETHGVGSQWTKRLCL